MNYWYIFRNYSFGFIVAWAVLSLLGIIVCTQFVMAALVNMGVEVPFSLRLATTWHDITNMWPLFGTIFGTGFLIAMLIGTMLTRWIKILPELIYALAGFAAIATTLWAMKLAFQITPIAAARSLTGIIALCLVGALAGYIYHRMTGKPRATLF